MSTQVESLVDVEEKEKLEAQCRLIVEALETERKIFEDMEFQQLEIESKYEEEKEEIQRQLLREQEALEETRRERESRLKEIDHQQREMLLACKKDTEALEVKREKLVAEFQLEKEKLKELEKLLQASGFITNSTPKSGVSTAGGGGGSGGDDPRRRLVEDAAGGRLSQSSDSDVSVPSDDLAARGNLPASPSPVLPAHAGGGGGGSNSNSAYNTLRSSAAQQEKRKLLEMKKKMIEDTLQALKAKSRVNTANNSPRNSPVHLQHPQSQPSPQHQNSKRHLSSSSLDPPIDYSPGGLTTTSDEFSTTGGESDLERGDNASGSSLSAARKSTGKSRNGSFHRQPQQQPPSVTEGVMESLPPEVQQLLANQLQQRSEEDRRVREELEQRLAEETQKRQVMEVQLREKKAAAAQARPLTRYLPVRGDGSGAGGQEFNLRAHIEMAGHQVDLCADVEVDAVSCRGFLHKLGGSKFKVWNRRWFVLDRSKRSLSYYTDKNESKPRGGIYFQSIQETYPDHLQTAVKSPNPKCTFVVKTLDRPYYLCAPSPEAMRIWVDVIFTGAEGYEAYMG